MDKIRSIILSSQQDRKVVLHYQLDDNLIKSEYGKFLPRDEILWFIDKEFIESLLERLLLKENFIVLKIILAAVYANQIVLSPAAFSKLTSLVSKQNKPIELLDLNYYI